MPSSRRRWSTWAIANSIGMPTLSRITFGAAPVEPRTPVYGNYVCSCPDHALAMAATLCTAAIFTEMGLV